MNTPPRRWLRSGLLAALSALSALCASTAGAADFTVIALPDTQNYSQSYPATYFAQTEWIVATRATYNTQFVTHLGDIVNEAGTPAQWLNASSAMAVLDRAGVPYGVVGGNHDFLYPGSFYDPNGVNYLQHFSPARYADKPWFGGASPSGLSNYEIITVDGKSYLFLHLLLETPAAELAWAQGVLNRHQDKPTWVSTHRYLFDWYAPGLAGRYDDFNYTFEPLYRHDGIRSDDFFNNFIAANKQIYMVYCGHNHSEYRQTSTNDFGLTVHEVLSDYQDSENGGNGWLRINTLRPETRRIDVRTYSPTLNRFRDNDFSDTELIGGVPLPDRDGSEYDSEFTLSVNFAEYVTSPGETVLHFQNGVAGYTGTEDTWLSEDEPNASFGNSSTLIVDDDTTNSFFGEAPSHGLIRFGNITQGPATEAAPSPTRIPTNGTVRAATLALTLSNDEELDNTTYRVYPMRVGWSESSTWNSLGGGVNTGSETGAQIATFGGDNDPDSDFGRSMSVTQTVASWVSGALANHGVAIIRDNTNFNDDGIDIHSSETASTILRPKLSVQVSFPLSNSAPAVQQPLTASPSSVDEGQEVRLSVHAVDPNTVDPVVLEVGGQSVAFATGGGTLEHFVFLEDDGNYTFSAVVSDDEASVAAGSVTVNVRNVAPVIVEMPANRITDVGRSVPLSATAVDAGPLDVLTYGWDTDGDGRYRDLEAASGVTSFDAPGSFEVGLEVRDDDGGMTRGHFTVTIVDTPANGDFDNDAIAIEGGTIVDADDSAALAFCMGAPPAPPAPYAQAHCLSAFDTDNDGDVGSDDERRLLSDVLPQPVPVSPWGFWVLAGALAGVGGRAARERKRSLSQRTGRRTTA